VSWSLLSETTATWASLAEAAKSWSTAASRSNTTGRNSSRFIGISPKSDGTGGIDFIYRITTEAGRERFFIENAAPISLRSTHNSPTNPF
jgi:hypothetical protein